MITQGRENDDRDEGQSDQYRYPDAQQTADQAYDCQSADNQGDLERQIARA